MSRHRTSVVKNLSSCRVLIAEDQTAMRMVLSMILESMGISHIVETADGVEAVDTLRKQYYQDSNEATGFDLIISDWKMPHKSGIELLREVRCNPRLKNLPYLMVSCIDDALSIEEAMSAGATSYVSKPFSTKTLRGTIRSVLHDFVDDNGSTSPSGLPET